MYRQPKSKYFIKNRLELLFLSVKITCYAKVFGCFIGTSG